VLFHLPPIKIYIPVGLGVGTVIGEDVGKVVGVVVGFDVTKVVGNSVG
jgi:hypothetical protein